MAILVDKHSRVVMQGMGRFHATACRAYGKGRKCFVAGVDAQHAGESLDGLPIFGSVREACEECGATVSVIDVAPADAAAAIDEAIDAGIELVVCITDGIPADDMARVRRRLQDSRTRLLGPACPGLITPGHIRIGELPEQGHRPGRIGVISRSAALNAEAARQLAAYGLGESTVVGVGSASGGLDHLDVLALFDADLGTDAVLMIGEMGDDVGERRARWIASHMRKPVVGFVPAGASTQRLDAMRACGITLTHNPAAMGEMLASTVAPQWLPFD